MTRRADREGMILLNVLLVMAVASVAVLVMIVAQDIQVQRGTRLRDAAQASAYARAGELSAVTVLRRDALTAAASDNLTEPWAQIGQEAIAVPGGRFALTIQDEQARFNLNSLRDGRSGPIDTFRRIGALVGIEDATLIRIGTAIRVVGPIDDLGPLVLAGVTPAELTALEPYVTVLPEAATLNLNTVSEPLLALLLNDPEAAAEVIRQRTQRGFVIPADIASAGAAQPEASGFVSDHYRVVTAVTVGDTRQRLTSRIARVRGDGTVDVVVTARVRDAG